MGTLDRRVTYRGGFSVRYFIAYQWRDTIVSWCLISAMFTITGLRVPLAHSVTIHLQSDFIRVRQWLPLPITQSIHSGFWSPTRANGVGSSARTTTKKERLHHLPAVSICPSYVQPKCLPTDTPPKPRTPCIYANRRDHRIRWKGGRIVVGPSSWFGNAGHTWPTPWSLPPARRCRFPSQAIEGE